MKNFIKFVIFTLFIGCFIYLGTREYKNDENKVINKEKKSTTYFDGSKVFSTINHSQLLDKMSQKNDLIFYVCIKNDDVCLSYAKLIEEKADEYNIGTIYYYEFSVDRKSNNGTYEKIVSKLSSYLETSDTGNQDLQSATLIFMKNGLVYSFDDELSSHRGGQSRKEYWNDERINALKTNYLDEVMKGFIINE